MKIPAHQTNCDAALIALFARMTMHGVLLAPCLLPFPYHRGIGAGPASKTIFDLNMLNSRERPAA